MTAIVWLQNCSSCAAEQDAHVSELGKVSAELSAMVFQRLVRNTIEETVPGSLLPKRALTRHCNWDLENRKPSLGIKQWVSLLRNMKFDTLHLFSKSISFIASSLEKHFSIYLLFSLFLSHKDCFFPPADLEKKKE